MARILGRGVNDDDLAQLPGALRIPTVFVGIVGRRALQKAGHQGDLLVHKRPVMLMDMAVETRVVLNQEVQAKRGLVQVDDHTPRPAALGIVHPALLGGRVIGVVQAETLGSLQVLGREDDGVLPIPGALFLPTPAHCLRP